MNLTDTELEALAIARSCAQAGQAFVPVPDAEIFCKNLARHGWLTPEPAGQRRYGIRVVAAGGNGARPQRADDPGPEPNQLEVAGVRRVGVEITTADCLLPQPGRGDYPHRLLVVV
jgi:hypothetical protein